MLDQVYDQRAFKRLVSRVSDGPDDCWLWQGAKDPKGYGRIGYAGKTVFTHRLAWTLMLGEIPEGLVLDHLCRQPSCCNPSHLDVVTQQTNLRRGEAAQRTHCPHGHEYTAENTYRSQTGWRRCRECARIRDAQPKRYGRKLVHRP